MTALERVNEWLVNRLTKTSMNNPKALGGAVLMKGMPDYQENTIKWLYIALQMMVSRFKHDTQGIPAGATKHCELALAIGRSVLMHGTGIDPTSHQQMADVGNLVIAAFHLEGNGYIEIERDEAYSEHAIKAPHIVSVNEKFEQLQEIPEALEKHLLRATDDFKIRDVTGMVQDNHRTVIKDASDVHEEDLKLAIEEDAVWLRGFNKLQQQGWTINLNVLGVINKEFDNLIQPVPPRPNLGSALKVAQAFEKLQKNDTPTNRTRYNREVKLWNKELESLSTASKNVEYSVIRAKANLLAVKPEFYQYLECDYRGRVYYYEPLMNYQGSDMARGLMLFNEEKRLGNSGVKWLAIHTAASFNQSYGIDEIPGWCSHDYAAMLKEDNLDSISVDKMTLEDRERWTWENMELILSSLETLHDCEKPFSFLACCHEWVKVSKEGEDALSALPVAIDGSCNGYQHSAAIAKDEITGNLVSLVPQEVQADLYLKAAQALVAKTPEFFEARPDMKMKHIRKGVSKRAVMTRAYSAGKDKIADSMYKDCHQYGYTDKYDITMLDCTDLSSDIYELIKTVCPGATRTMKFLQDLATYELGKFEYFDSQGSKVSKNKRKKLHARKQKLRKIKPNEITEEEIQELTEVSATLDSHELRCTYGNGAKHMEWVTPTGFRVIYEAYIQRDEKLKSTIPGWTGGATSQPGRITMVHKVDLPYPNVQAFQSGISPNFIHSMDASHLAAVVADWDGAFGAVHDSFSAHACDIDKLSQLTREKFVEIYNVEDPYAAIAEMVLSPCVYEEELPELGSLDIEEVLKAQYFFC